MQHYFSPDITKFIEVPAKQAEEILNPEHLEMKVENEIEDTMPDMTMVTQLVYMIQLARTSNNSAQSVPA